MYQPSSEILQKYADLLVKFALADGRGVQPGESVWLRVPKGATDFYSYLKTAIREAGANSFVFELSADQEDPDEYLGSDAQVAYFPEHLLRGVVEQADHMIAILAPTDKFALSKVEPSRILKRSNAFRPYMHWREEKENAGKFNWTLAAYATEGMAKDAGLSLQEYWEQIIAACYLDAPDPTAEWRRVMDDLHAIRGRLNALSIKTLTVEAPDIHLTVGIGPNRHWLGGSGKNIPSFELFISPDWRLTEGTISFNQPLYRYGNLIKEVSLRFEGGKVVEATASEGQDLLREMIASENADKIGEFSLTDKRYSRITKPMGETLFDENMGGPNGNTHLALGNAYQDSYPGDIAAVTESQWQEWGFNSSSVHTDIISTTPRTVTAHLEDGTSQVIYKDGQFTV